MKPFSRMKIDSFVLAILVAIGLAYVFPQPGLVLPLDKIATAGIALIFFFYGLKLSPEKIKAGLKNWKLHILVQLSTFLLFPILILIIKPLFIGADSQVIWLSLFFLAALPSTVSSSVVMVSMAKGNIPAAIFNASISGLIGILLTPLWMSLFLTSNSIDVSEVYHKLLLEILLPLVLGLLLHKKFGLIVQKNASYFSLFDRAVILLIIYKSFVHSFESNVFSGLKPIDLLLLTLGVLVLFFMVYLIITLISKLLKFNTEDRITALFCGTKKSLVHGTVFSKVLFAGSSIIGIILLPLMLFHMLQILIVSIIAKRYAQRAD